ncbi:MAG: GGDEF domain-containing protein, partial [Moritella dasanensis]
MKRVKFIVLTIVILIFSACSIISTRRHTQVTDLLTLSMKSVGWATSELELETLKFMQALKLTALNDMRAEDLQLRFELLWSRVEVLSVGEETHQFRSRPGAMELLLNFKQRLVELESEVLSIKMGDESAIRLIQDFKFFQTQVRKFNVNSFSGDQAWGNLEQIQSIENDSKFYLLGLLLSGSILIILVIRESSVNRKQALHDSLTGLANRYLFQNNLKKSIFYSRRNNSRAAVHIIGMNGFKEVNDRLGHAVGDELLQEVASRLALSVCLPDTVARLGGDVFGIIQNNITNADECV